MLEIHTWRARPEVDEADQIDPVLRVLEQLPGHELAHVACADDHRVLQIGDVPAAEAPCDAPRDRDEHDGRDQEERKPAEGGLGDPERPQGQRDHPQTRRRQMEDADDVFRRRVIGALLVALVEAVELRQDDPERQADQEEQRLAADRQAAAEQPRLAREGLCHQERERQADDVGHEQRAPNQPATPLVGPCGAALVENRAGPVVDRPDQPALERRAQKWLSMGFRH